MPTPAAPSCLVYVIFLQSAATVPAVTGREAVMVEANSGESIKKKKDHGEESTMKVRIMKMKKWRLEKKNPQRLMGIVLGGKGIKILYRLMRTRWGSGREKERILERVCITGTAVLTGAYLATNTTVFGDTLSSWGHPAGPREARVDFEVRYLSWSLDKNEGQIRARIKD